MGDAAGVRSSGNRTVNRALRLLRIIGEASAPVPFTMAARQLGTGKAVTHRLVSSLVESGLVERDPIRGYRLGSAIVRLAWRYLSSLDVVRVARPSLRHLLDICDETVALHVRQGDDRVCVAQVDCSHPIRRIWQLGEPIPITFGGVGRALLSREADIEIASLLVRYGLPTSPMPGWGTDRYWTELRLGQERGYFISDQERFLGVVGVSFPVIGPTETVVAAVSATGPSTRFTVERIDELLPELLGVIHSLEVRLGRMWPNSTGTPVSVGRKEQL